MNIFQRKVSKFTKKEIKLNKGTVYEKNSFRYERMLARKRLSYNFERFLV